MRLIRITETVNLEAESSTLSRGVSFFVLFLFLFPTSPIFDILFSRVFILYLHSRFDSVSIIGSDVYSTERLPRATLRSRNLRGCVSVQSRAFSSKKSTSELSLQMLLLPFCCNQICLLSPVKACVYVNCIPRRCAGSLPVVPFAH